MKNLKYILSGLLITVFSACQDLVDDINPNPNDLSIDIINPEDLLTGAQLANTLVQVGHMARISGLYSGQLIGYQAQYKNIYDYNIASEETQSSWNRAYQGVVPQVRVIRERALAKGDTRLVGISKVMEADAIGTLASLLGNVPYAEIFNGDQFSDPGFDSQSTIFGQLQSLLDDAIVDFGSSTSGSFPEDIYYNGDVTKWTEAAWTLKARYFMHTKDYPNAYSAAQNGISSAANTLLFIPRGASGGSGDKNLFFTLLAGSRAGDIGSAGGHLEQLIDPANASSRNNAKTDETARSMYYAIDESSGAANSGVVNEFEPQKQISYEENLLILAEAGARSQNFSVGLGHLNELRQYLNTGAFLNANFSGQAYTYADYVTADFQAGGMENQDNISQDKALLREIIEERYVSGFLGYMPFDDARRLRKTDTDILVSFPFNTPIATAHPERLPYPDEELNSNANAPDPVPGLFQATELNQ